MQSKNRIRLSQEPTDNGVVNKAVKKVHAKNVLDTTSQAKAENES